MKGVDSGGVACEGVCINGGLAAMLYVIVNGCHLFEMTQADYDHSCKHNGEGYQRIVHWTRAHEWVRNDNPHSTPLWLDDFGRIRRA